MQNGGMLISQCDQAFDVGFGGEVDGEQKDPRRGKRLGHVAGCGEVDEAADGNRRSTTWLSYREGVGCIQRVLRRAITWMEFGWWRRIQKTAKKLKKARPMTTTRPFAEVVKLAGTAGTSRLAR